MSGAAEIFDDLQLLEMQCGIGRRELDAMPDVIERRILAALDTYKAALAEPDGDFNSARERLRETVQVGREAMMRPARR